MYTYPVGDFLSGFSEDPANPNDYELECQRMVIRGVEYLDKNQELFDKIGRDKLNVSSPELEPMINYMCLNEQNEEESFGQTGAMVVQTVNHSYIAKKMGWNEYIKKITESPE